MKYKRNDAHTRLTYNITWLWKKGKMNAAQHELRNYLGWGQMQFR